MHAVDLHRPTVVINCAAYTKVDLAEVERDAAFAINTLAAGTIASACKSRGIRLVHFSTDFVFNGESSGPYQPNDPTDCLSAYGQSKLEGESLVRAIDPPGWMIIRTAWLFGDTGPCFPKTILDRARAGQTLKVVNDQIGSPTYAPDLAATTLDLIGASACGIRHVTNSGQCSWFDFAEAIVDAAGMSANLQPTTTAGYRATRPNIAIRPAFSVLADDKLPQLIGRHMRPWQEALSDFILSYRSSQSLR
jgi:dTDP-4-dehydrorhamnose reductase